MSKYNMFTAHKNEIIEKLEIEAKVIAGSIEEAIADFQDGFFDLGEFLEKLTDLGYEHYNSLSLIGDCIADEDIFNEMCNNRLEFLENPTIFNNICAIIDNCKNNGIELDSNALDRVCRDIESEKKRANNSMEFIEIESEM